MGRDYTALPHEYLDEMDCLSDAEFGRLIRALLKYSATGEPDELQGRESILWKRVQNREDRYRESFDNMDKAKADRAKSGAKARWGNAKNAKACLSITSNAKNAKTKAKTETKANTEAKENTPLTPQGDVFAAFAAGDGALLEALKDFEAMRKKIKAPLTDRAKTGIVNDLKKHSDGDHGIMVKILEESIKNDWKGVYALKTEAKQPAKQGYTPPDYTPDPRWSL